MSKKITSLLLGALVCLQLIGTQVAFAEEESQQAIPKMATESVNLGNVLKAPGQNLEGKTNIGLYITRLVNFLSLVIGSFAFLAIVIGGIILLTSGGREAQLTRGKDIIKFAIIGVVVALSAYWITAFVQSIFFEYGTGG
ncbi:MAG TPA: hypothetical protein VI588_01185 [Candidatus Gracilibacteria bacterium]|nr:hypothetical protein [Candidatus Gracilibacteria bacterium]